MSPYALTLLCLFSALLAQATASGLMLELWLRREQAHGQRSMWLAFSLGNLLLSLHHGYTLELAARTGLFDLRQAALATLAGLLIAFASWRLRRREA